MNAVLQQRPTSDTILTYATEQDLEEVRQVFLRGDALKADVLHIRTALGVAMRNLERHNFNALDRERNAAARALGESVPADAPAGRSVFELRDESVGLQTRLAEAERAAEFHATDYRAAVY